MNEMRHGPGPGIGESSPSRGSRQPVPKNAIVVGIAALSIPVVVTLLVPTRRAGLEPLVWLVAVLPVLLLAYHRGRRGAVVASVVGLAVLVLTQGVLRLMVNDVVPQWGSLLAIASAYVAVCVAAGYVAESLHVSRERAESLALTDELTGIPNRRHLRLVLEHAFAAAERGRPLTVALFDLDRFKRYNDQHGHVAGDVALRAFARMLHATTRRMNTSGRYGGEEFLSVLSEADVESSMVFVERVRQRTRSLDLAVGSISVSAGVASYHPGMKTANDLIAAADAVLFRAKSAGGDAICVAAPPRAPAPWTSDPRA